MKHALILIAVLIILVVILAASIAVLIGLATTVAAGPPIDYSPGVGPPALHIIPTGTTEPDALFYSPLPTPSPTMTNRPTATTVPTHTPILPTPEPEPVFTVTPTPTVTTTPCWVDVEEDEPPAFASDTVGLDDVVEPKFEATEEAP
jgi:serine/threonine-protein kinase